MSQENVEIARAMYEKTSRGGRLDAAFEFLAPEVEFHVSGAFPDLDPVYRGHEVVRRLNDQLNEPWEHFTLVPDRFIDLGEQVSESSRLIGRARLNCRKPETLRSLVLAPLRSMRT